MMRTTSMYPSIAMMPGRKAATKSLPIDSCVRIA